MKHLLRKQALSNRLDIALWHGVGEWRHFNDLIQAGCCLKGSNMLLHRKSIFKRTENRRKENRCQTPECGECVRLVNSRVLSTTWRCAVHNDLLDSTLMEVLTETLLDLRMWDHHKNISELITSFEITFAWVITTLLLDIAWHVFASILRFSRDSIRSQKAKVKKASFRGAKRETKNYATKISISTEITIETRHYLVIPTAKS